jgi:hypothetical protein
MFVAALLGGLASVMGSMVGRVLLALGISFVTYKGASVGIDSVVVAMKTHFASFGGEIGLFVSWLWVDKALSMIVSAFTSALVLRGAAGAVTKMVIKK